MDVDSLLKELWEIDENLMRADLTAMERADHTARRADIREKRAESLMAQNEPKVAHRPSRGQVAFVEETASMTGKSKASVKRDKRRGEKIAAEVKDAINNTPTAESGAELDAIADLTPAQQIQAVKMVKSGKVINYRYAKKDLQSEERGRIGGAIQARDEMKKQYQKQFEKLEQWQPSGGEIN